MGFMFQNEQLDSSLQLIERGPQAASRIKRIALIGNHAPRRCGIATFTTDLHAAFADRFPEIAVDVYAMNDRQGTYDYPDQVVASIDEDSPFAYLEAARAIDASGADLVWLQHEYGIFGGPAGDHVLKLLDRVSAPVVVTLHTVLSHPDPNQRRVMEAIVRRAARLIVMAEYGRELLIDLYGARPAQVAVIAHGIPDRPFVETGPMKKKLGLAGRDVILTFGLLSPGKGIETMIEAMPAIVEACPASLYVVLGATHPRLIAEQGEAYRDRLHRQAEELGVSEHIRWIDRFVELEELLDYLTAADIYVTPYLNPAQLTSGTLAYAVGLGKPVVATPYLHAAELLADDHGRLVDFGDSDGFAREIIDLIGNPSALDALRRRTYALGRTMIWPRLAEMSLEQFEGAMNTTPALIRSKRPTPAIPDSVSFASILRLSDDTGIYQHSIFSIPDRDHGYCVDDNARALMLMHRLTDLPDADYDRWTEVYSSFVQHAWNPDTARFRNFMAFDRRWLESEGSEDSSARSLWSLGVTARDARHQSYRNWASHLFDQVAAHAFDLTSPRAHAFTMLAATAMLDTHPGHLVSRRILERGGAALMALVDEYRRPDWAWFEIVLAYDNCRLPEALLRAGMALGRDDFVARGIETLDWIVDQQTAKSGVFRPVGSESFGRVYAPPLPFDQQPLEAWATIDGCDAAFAATGDQRWKDEGLRAYRWFQGENDLGARIGNPANGECFDGLMPNGVNQNHGAESVLAFHLATCAIKGLIESRAAVPETSFATRR